MPRSLLQQFMVCGPYVFKKNNLPAKFQGALNNSVSNVQMAWSIFDVVNPVRATFLLPGAKVTVRLSGRWARRVSSGSSAISCHCYGTVIVIIYATFVFSFSVFLLIYLYLYFYGVL
ncbi:hypothetical protein [Brenneria tiliae]|uniref:hypothetical protein n=1 Tax=Brenneria tiliae TaxID=2914984 RepID=UPI0020148493|nr:hypothetical protein [Brenneria tiliae]